MGPAPRSVSTSFASFEAELEGAILHHTGAIDLYLERHHASAAAAAAALPGGTEQQHATPQKLQALWQGDLNSGFWQALSSYGGEISLFDDGPLAAVSSSGGLDAATVAGGVPQLARPVKRRPRAAPLQVGESRLEAFLQQDLQRYISLQEQQADSQNEQAASVQLAAGLAASLHSRRSSSGSGSFVRLPDYNPEEAVGDADDVAPLAPAAAAAAAAAAALADAASSHGSSGLLLPMLAVPEPGSSTSGRGDAAAPAPAGEQQQQQPAAAAAATAAAAMAVTERPRGALPFAMECDEDLAAQKQAARVRLAELQGDAAAAGSSGAAAASAHAAAAAASSKAAAGCKDWERSAIADGGSSGAAGSLHSSAVPQRPRGLAARPGSGLLGAGGQPGVDLAGPLHQQLFGVSASKGDPLGLGPAALAQQFKFAQAMLLGLVMCTGLLLLLWAHQGWAAGAAPGSRQAWLAAKLALWGGYAYLPSAGVLLLYLMSSVVALRPALLHFPDPDLESRYLAWSNGGKLFVDGCFQALLLLVGACLWLRLKHGSPGLGDDQAALQARLLLAGVSLTSGGLPVLLLLQRTRYLQHREALLAGSRVATILALVLTPLAPAGAAAAGAGLGGLPVSMPFVALAQLMGIACMQVRLATFVPCQALHVFVLLCKMRAGSPLLHLAQLLGGGLFLPCLLLHSMELYSRKAFVATFSGRASSGGASSPKVV